jgi:hypothetical protein
MLSGVLLLVETHGVEGEECTTEPSVKNGGTNRFVDGKNASIKLYSL